LKDETVVFYRMSEFYHSECAMGVRWDYPFFNISWPTKNPTLPEKDKNWPL
jgi:dTDP-4-dehydrorhamnose 3,5-epimerase